MSMSKTARDKEEDYQLTEMSITTTSHAKTAQVPLPQASLHPDGQILHRGIAVARLTGCRLSHTRDELSAVHLRVSSVYEQPMMAGSCELSTYRDGWSVGVA